MVVDGTRERRAGRIADSSFDRASWSWDNARLAGAGAVVVFAAGMFSVHNSWFRALAVVAVVELLVVVLPWRVPRAGRSGPSFWAESLAGTVSALGAIAVVAVAGPSWLSQVGDWWWYVVAVPVAAGLLAVSGLEPEPVWRGDIAFVLGPTPRSHAAARIYAATVGTVGEEFLFRAPAVLWIASPPLALLAAVGFAGRHYVQPGDNRRGSVRQTTAELTAALALLVITELSKSIYPALVVHVLNNLPQIVMELQRESGRADDDGWATSGETTT